MQADIANSLENGHNMPVTVERDDQPTPSIPQPQDVSARSASQPQGGNIDIRERDEPVTDAPAITAKSKPATIREFERALQTLGFSQRESKAVASGGFKSIFKTEAIDLQINTLAESLAKYRNIFES